jgi:hypothetical protein
MSWSGGSELMSEVIHALDKHVPSETMRRKLYSRLIQVWENNDWDAADECMGEDPAYDEALRKLKPEWFRDSV